MESHKLGHAQRRWRTASVKVEPQAFCASSCAVAQGRNSLKPQAVTVGCLPTQAGNVTVRPSGHHTIMPVTIIVIIAID
eukprot:2092559-Rhodomonas_salina.1